MNKFIKNNKIILGAAVCLLISGITMSFQTTSFGPIDKLDTLTDLQDSIPEKPKDEEVKMKMKDFDLLIRNMDFEILKMQKEVGKIDLNKMHEDITASLNKVDFDKIKTDIDKAVNEVDFAKIEQGVRTALKEVDWTQVNDDVKIALQSAKKELDKLDMDAIKKEIEKAKVEIEKSKKEIKKINVDEIINNANAGIARAKEELRLTKQMFNEMEKDGLISQKNGFTIEYKDKNFIINGKKQSEAITRKYQQYIKGESFKISIGKE